MLLPGKDQKAQDIFFVKFKRAKRLDRLLNHTCGEHADTMFDPTVSPEQACMLGKFPVVLWACPPQKDTHQLMRGSLPTFLE